MQVYDSKWHMPQNPIKICKSSEEYSVHQIIWGSSKGWNYLVCTLSTLNLLSSPNLDTNNCPTTHQIYLPLYWVKCAPEGHLISVHPLLCIFVNPQSAHPIILPWAWNLLVKALKEAISLFCWSLMRELRWALCPPPDIPVVLCSSALLNKPNNNPIISVLPGLFQVHAYKYTPVQPQQEITGHYRLLPSPLLSPCSPLPSQILPALKEIPP